MAWPWGPSLPPIALFSRLAHHGDPTLMSRLGGDEFESLMEEKAMAWMKRSLGGFAAGLVVCCCIFFAMGAERASKGVSPRYSIVYAGSCVYVIDNDRNKMYLY